MQDVAKQQQPSSNHGLEKCHNCRRQRLKCDRTIPQCLKCISRGCECLGYQRLLRWETGVASRGRMAGKTFSQVDMQRNSRCSAMVVKRSSPMLGSPVDPLLQDLSTTTRNYLYHFTSHVCSELVLYDSQNPFYDLIPRAQQHPVLLHTIVAVSALRMSNVYPKRVLDMAPATDEPMHEKVVHDALTAKQRALQLFQAELQDVATMDVDVVLAVSLLFIELELIDSGQDHWKHYLKGAHTIIENMVEERSLELADMSPLRKAILANIKVFAILGSLTSSSEPYRVPDRTDDTTLCLLQDAEGNHCSSYPTALLHHLQSGAQLLQHCHSVDSAEQIHEAYREKALFLVEAARSFDPFTWAIEISSPVPDLIQRQHVAAAHRAATCIYLARVADSIGAQPGSFETMHWVDEIIENLSYIGSGDALFTATTWPTFIAGLETDSHEIRGWTSQRFGDLWRVEPWGVNREALCVLKTIWARTTQAMSVYPTTHVVNWIDSLRELNRDWLIV